MKNKLRIAPGGHMRALHSLIIQFIALCTRFETKFQEENVVPYMDVRGKQTGFHLPGDELFRENVWNRWFIQPDVHWNELWWGEACSPETDTTILVANEPREKFHDFHRAARKWLHYKPYITDQVDKFVNENFKGKVVGFHLRGSDSFLDTGRPHISLAYFRDMIQEKLQDYDTIYIATDSIEYLNYFKHYFGDRVVSYPIKEMVLMETYDFRPIHEYPQDPYASADEVLIEALLLSKVDLLVRGQSNITTYALVENPNMKFHQVDLPFYDNDRHVGQNFWPERDYSAFYMKELEVEKHDHYLAHSLEFENIHFSMLEGGLGGMDYDKLREIVRDYIYKI